MLTKTKAAMVAVLAAAVVGITATGALASVWCNLSVVQFGSSYGDDAVLIPSVPTTTVPGDKFVTQTLQGEQWVAYGEGITVEETNVVDPLMIMVDESLTYPAQLRSVFTPKKTTVPTVASEPVTVEMDRHDSTRVLITAPATLLARRAYSVSGRVIPSCGPGTLSLVLYKLTASGKVVVKRATLTTDELGQASTALTVVQKGSYQLQMRWAGNRFGVASPVVTKRIVVR